MLHCYILKQLYEQFFTGHLWLDNKVVPLDKEFESVKKEGKKERFTNLPQQLPSVKEFLLFCI